MEARSEYPTSIRLAELMAALSLATDLGMGQPLEFALNSCIVAVRLGDSLGLSEQELSDVYYQALLRYIGCNAETYLLAALFGDEIALRTDFATVDQGRPSEVMGIVFRYLRLANAGASPVQLARSVAEGLIAAPRVARESFTGHCEVAQRLAERLGLGEGVVVALGQLYERWDGKGLPNGLKREAISPAVRVVSLAQDAVTFHRIDGVDAAVAIAKERRGTAYDPHMVDCFCRYAPQLLAAIEDEPSWETVLDIEPGLRVALSPLQLDGALEAMADFADIKSPYTLGHSTGVGMIAGEAAIRYGLPQAEATAVRRAGLLHDIGRVGVSAGIWGKQGPLSEREWERVRLHPYFTERILARPDTLARLGTMASHHHERLDGSGYHRGISAAALSPEARLLAAADTYQAMTEDRPHRPAHSPEFVRDELQRKAEAGRLDPDAVTAVLEAAGHRIPRRRREFAAGLSEREVEVLRLVARGNSIKQIADALFISAKTADNHIQHIYTKIDVSTRAGATLFAMEHGLLSLNG